MAPKNLTYFVGAFIDFNLFRKQIIDITDT